MQMKKGLWAGLFITTLSIYGLTRAASQEGGNNQSDHGIQFGDPTHSPFFKYQGFLIQHGKGGYTRETWESLPVADQSQKVRDGETLLTRIHSELLSKSNRTAEEADLLMAVWGGSEITAHNPAPSQSGFDSRNQKRMTDHAKALTQSPNWGRIFDGSRNNSGEAGEVVAGANAADSSASRLTGVNAANSRPLDQTHILPPAVDASRTPANHSAPLALGLLTVAGISAGAYALRYRAEAQAKPEATAQVSPREVQVDALQKMADNPPMMYEYLRDPAAYSAKHKVVFDPAVEKMVQTTLSQHERDIARLVSGNKYRDNAKSDIVMAGSTAEAVTSLVSTAAAVVAACAAVAVAVA